MTQTSEAPVSAAPPVVPSRTNLHRLALVAILLLAAVLYGWAIGSIGWGNSYYSAAVKSMGRSWTNFLFGSYDPAGVVTVDKPPAALWPQVISTKIFGIHGWAMLLPQVLEGVAGVFVLHRTVRRWAGEHAGLLAALVMTLTPITVAINRDNNPDTLLVLLLVAAAYALTRALQSEPGRRATWWLCASGFLVGCGFLTKMMAAWMILPALAAAWLVGATGPWLARIVRLLIAGAVCAVASLWWVAVVAWWPGDRPYIGGSEDGSAWDLVVGYNGLGRIFGESVGGSGGGGGGFGGGGGGFGFGGASGLWRMFNDQVAGQISWLLPACGAALLVAVAGVVLRRRGKTSAGDALPGSGWVLWGTWLIVCAAVFSSQEGIFHPYYTTQLAPAIGALTAGLVTALVRAHRAGARWALPVGAATVLVTAGWAIVVVRREPDWNGWLAWAAGLLGLIAIGLLLFAARKRRLLPWAVGGALAATLITPTAWAVSVTSGSGGGMGGTNPTAGPSTMGFGGGGGGRGGFQLPSGGASTGTSGGGTSGQQPQGMPSGMPSGMPGGTTGNGGGNNQSGGMPSFPGNSSGGGGGGGGGRGGGFGGGDSLTSDQKKILAYVVKNSGDARIKLAVEGGATATSSYILNSDEVIIGMGGFGGTDDAPSVDQLKEWTKSGELRYVLGGGGFGGMGGGDNPSTERSDWLTKNCTEVPAESYGGTSDDDTGDSGMMGGASTLYDCAAKS